VDNQAFKGFVVKVLVIVVGGAFLSLFIVFIDDYFSAKSLQFAVISSSRLTKDELLEVAETEDLDFQVSLDDPFLTDYWLVMGRLRSLGSAIEESLTFAVDLGAPLSKFLDVTHKVLSPASKVIPLEHSIPDLQWNMESTSGAEQVTVEVQPDQDEPVGYLLYASRLADVGFGRLSDEVLLEPTIQLPLSAYAQGTTPVYYKISAISCNGESQFAANPLRFPELLAFMPKFADVVWIDPSISSDNVEGKAQSGFFGSIDEALGQDSEAATIIVKQRRSEVTNPKNLSPQINVLYWEDLDFLRGKVTLTFPTGLDKGTDITLYFLFKTLGQDLSPSLTLEGSPNVEFEANWGHLIAEQARSDRQDVAVDTRQILTPKMLTAFSGQDSIFLVWSGPETTNYDGFKIFRKPANSEVEGFGVEVYYGNGSTDAINCDCQLPRSLLLPEASESSPYVPPQPSDPRVRPSPPPRFAVYAFRNTPVNLKNGEYLPFFADDHIVPGDVYTYTLFTYAVDEDDAHTYSYPVTTTVSLSNRFLFSGCIAGPQN